MCAQVQVKMSKSKSGEFFRAQAFVQSLRALIESLPTEADRQQIDSQLETLIRFVNELRLRLSAIPSQRDAADARGAISHLDALFAEAKANPVVAAAFGVKPAVIRRKTEPLGSEDIERARSTAARLEALPIDELRGTVNSMPPRELQAIAGRAAQKVDQTPLGQ